MTDYVGLVVARLVADWLPTNTDNFTPTIRKIIEVEHHDMTRSDFIGVYAIDESEEARYIGYAGAKWKTGISFTLATAQSHIHLIKARDEARRVIHAARKTLVADDNVLWHWKRAIDVSDKRYGTWKYVIDTEIEVPTELIP